MMAAERGASANTLVAYGRDLEGYVAFLSAQGWSVEIATTDNIRQYLSTFATAGLAPSTAARRLSSIRQLHRFLFVDGLREDDPTVIIDSPRQARTLPKVLRLRLWQMLILQWKVT